jgi:hypothetical protein
MPGRDLSAIQAPQETLEAPKYPERVTMDDQVFRGKSGGRASKKQKEEEQSEDEQENDPMRFMGQHVETNQISLNETGELNELKRKIIGYKNNLSHMVSKIQWPDIDSLDIDAARKLYSQIRLERDTYSTCGGGLLHNGIAHAMEQIGIHFDLCVNGYAQAMQLPAGIDVKERLKELVKIMEVEYGIGIQNPMLEYAAIMIGTFSHCHMTQKLSKDSLWILQQQAEVVPRSVVTRYDNL